MLLHLGLEKPDSAAVERVEKLEDIHGGSALLVVEIERRTLSGIDAVPVRITTRWNGGIPIAN